MIKFRKEDKKMERYNQILSMCKTPKFLNDIADVLYVSRQTIKHDINVLSMLNFVSIKLVNDGQFNTTKNQITTLRTDLTQELFNEMLNLSSNIYRKRDKREPKQHIEETNPHHPVYEGRPNVKVVRMLSAPDKDLVEKLNHSARQLRTHQHTGIGSSFGLVGW